MFVDADELENCPECGCELGSFDCIKRRIVEELPNLEPMRAIEFEEILKVNNVLQSVKNTLP